MDLGFERAGFRHVASYDVLDICGETLQANRPSWHVLSGAAGDVTAVDWRRHEGAVDVLHGGPPCQPFSIAGKRDGNLDSRDMWPTFVAAVLAIRPRAFLAENVPGLLAARFRQYVHESILAPLSSDYLVQPFTLSADDFGVPQVRKRVFFVGFSHGEQLHIWPNGVQGDRDAAARFPPENGHFRLSVQDCAVLQGFPDGWSFRGATYQIIGQIGNSVCPPVGYAIADALRSGACGRQEAPLAQDVVG